MCLLTDCVPLSIGNYNKCNNNNNKGCEFWEQKQECRVWERIEKLVGLRVVQRTHIQVVDGQPQMQQFVYYNDSEDGFCVREREGEEVEGFGWEASSSSSSWSFFRWVVAFSFYDAHGKMITIISIMLMRKMGVLLLVIVAFCKDGEGREEDAWWD